MGELIRFEKIECKTIVASGDDGYSRGLGVGGRAVAKSSFQPVWAESGKPLRWGNRDMPYFI